MSDDEGYAPAAQMLICFIFPACVQKNTDADDRCHTAFCCKLLLFSGLRRLRQDLVNLIARLEGRRPL